MASLNGVVRSYLRGIAEEAGLDREEHALVLAAVARDLTDTAKRIAAGVEGADADTLPPRLNVTLPDEIPEPVSDVLEPGGQVRLVMMHHDAMVLHAILEHVGGDPKGPRGAQGRITRSLEELGIVGSISNVGKIILPDGWPPSFKKRF